MAQRLNRTLAAFYDEPAPADLATRLSHHLADLLGVETACFDAFGPAGMGHLGGNAPNFFSQAHLSEFAARHQEHPLFLPCFKQPQMVFKITDFISEHRYRRSSFYNDLCRPMHLVHQLGMVLHVPGHPPISCMMMRNRRDFTETDRLLLTLLLPQLRALLRLLPPAAPADTPSLVGLGLTPREVQILTCLAQGQPDKLIAYRCGISSRTVQVHLRNIYAKLGVDNRTAAALHYHAATASYTHHEVSCESSGAKVLNLRHEGKFE